MVTIELVLWIYTYNIFFFRIFVYLAETNVLLDCYSHMKEGKLVNLNH